jgi:hypothetical protein
MTEDYVTLKWGTLKSCQIEDPETFALLQKWSDLGSSLSAMAQHDTDEQKQLICEIIDRIGKPVYLDWDGEYVSVEEAKNYVLNYGKD